MKRDETTGQFKSPWEGSFLKPEVYHGKIQVIADTNEGDIVCPLPDCQYPDAKQAALRQRGNSAQ